MENNNFRYNEQTKDSEFRIRKQELVEFIVDKNNGNTIRFEEIGKILKLNIELEDDFQRLKRIMGSLKPYLIKQGKLLKSVKGTGYYILRFDEYSSHCYRTYINGSRRMIDKSIYILNFADPYGMSAESQSELDDMKELSQNLADVMHKTVNESKFYHRKTFYENSKK